MYKIYTEEETNTREISETLGSFAKTLETLPKYRGQKPTFVYDGQHVTMYLTQNGYTFPYRKVNVDGDSAQGVLFDLFEHGNIL